MHDKQKIIEIAKSRLGSPIVQLELTDEICDNLFSDAVSTFGYYIALARLDENNVFYKITSEDIGRIEYVWVCKYLTALFKEALGNIRGKFGGEINIPSGSLKLEYSHLIRESESEKKSLIKDIYPRHEYNASPFVLLGVYVNVGNLDKDDAESIMKKVSKSLSEKLPEYVKTIIMPSKDESKVELIYSNNLNKEIDLDFYEHLKSLDEDLEKYIKDEK